ncbi:hypothetical protein THAOC_13448 [Thalassiosira oceanica]|uniref:Uncharacterized protein n=1 Tax=Thalassiosira oceanica TaxID=159749 RepID=K0SHQ3_THAOC|nr:hypothetical protein THAOC_13448 [Thalassiosira oceanica]|eukprot:EJK65668.1 hypothetical protein THAOC_13448 [Thalassiosira oceanica]
MAFTKYFAAFAPAMGAAAFNWKPGLSPSFSEFANSSVGPWSFVDEKLENPVSCEVEEVMRSCGGAVQGIRELPIKFLFESEDEGERSYHNRADGGFVYFDDGSYSAAGTKCSSSSAGVLSNSGPVMASLSFPGNRRLWLNAKEPVLAGNPTNDHIPAKMLELSRIKPLVKSNRECNTKTMPLIQWSSILRARMPSPQPWSLPRSKWEKTAVSDDAEPFRDDGCTFDRPLLGWTCVDSVESGDPFSDIVHQGIVLHMLGVCPESRIARSIARCYGSNDGELKSVAYLQGLAADELAG